MFPCWMLKIRCSCFKHTCPIPFDTGHAMSCKCHAFATARPCIFIETWPEDNLTRADYSFIDSLGVTSLQA